ncbi:MAG: ligase-associated DNA damage response endonuclease PdeM [Sphingobacteriales bacterium]|nr:MAG: ligase-associated DNA damage response endonuclease PdeM [Sphingobacteriales bacterium]
MTPPVKFVLKENVFWLSSEKAIFWEDKNALIISDLHFGKTGHFRKSGIAVPQAVYKKDLQRLFHLVQFFKPQQLLIVGDMFHSEENKEIELFKRWRNDNTHTSVKLIKGNHDILEERMYDEMQIELIPDELRIGDFIFAHHPTENSEAYVFSGHIHPGVRLSGLGKQSLRFPCFYFTPSQAILPAFGGFTGFVAVEPTRQDKVFAIVNNNVVPI